MTRLKKHELRVRATVHLRGASGTVRPGQVVIVDTRDPWILDRLGYDGFLVPVEPGWQRPVADTSQEPLEAPYGDAAAEAALPAAEPTEELTDAPAAPERYPG